jgi:hypothetical protein
MINLCARESRQRLWAHQTMRVGDDADEMFIFER